MSNPIKFKDVVEVELVTRRARRPYANVSARVYVKNAEDSATIVRELALIGFKDNLFAATKFVDSGGGMEYNFDKAGTGLFNGWTAAESNDNMADLRAVFRKFGLGNMGVRTLTLAEQL